MDLFNKTNKIEELYTTKINVYNRVINYMQENEITDVDIIYEKDLEKMYEFIQELFCLVELDLNI